MPDPGGVIGPLTQAVWLKTVVTALGSFPTGTEIADAVTGYSLALVRAQTVDVVDIPFVTPDGTVSRIELRIGWLADIVVIAGEPVDDEPLEVQTALRLRTKTLDLDIQRAADARVAAFRNIPGRGEPDWDELI